MKMSLSWIAYRDMDAVYVQNTMLWPGRFPQAGLEGPHIAAPERRTRSTEPETDGEPISEWRTSSGAIAAFATHLNYVMDTVGE